MQINYFGPDSDFFESAFENTPPAGHTILLNTPTQLIIQHPNTGAVTTINGSGMAFNALGDPIAGTVSGITFQQSGSTVATFSSFSWSFVAMVNAIDALEVNNNAPLNALFASSPLTFDASTATTGFDPTNFDIELAGGVTLTGSDFNDDLGGGSGNDVINPRESAGYDQVYGSQGNDTIIYTNSLAGYQELNYSDLAGAITVNLNGITNTATVNKGALGTDTITDIQNPLISGWTTGGLGLYGTASNDVFNLTTADDTWMQVGGGAGNDTFNLNINGGTIRINYGWDGANGPMHGITMDLSTNTVSDDGFGGTDTFNVTGSRLEIRGTSHADTMIGGSGDDRFILSQGNDTADGGAGYDTLRYDRNGVEAVTVDLGAGTATGVWHGQAFTHTISNFEEIRGSRNDNDRMTGDANANNFFGKGGNDILLGAGGDDRLRGEDGNDSIYGGTGRDHLYGGNGDDYLDASAGDRNTEDFGDNIQGGLGTNTIIGNSDLFASGDGINVVFDDLSGVGGITLTVGTNGTGTGISGTAGMVNTSFTFAHYFEGSLDSDTMTGSGHSWEGWDGRSGNDTIDGGGGTDRIVYRYDYDQGGNAGITANLTTGIVIDGFGDTDTVMNIEEVQGTEQSDRITGNAGYNRLQGEGGNDTLLGAGGDDRLEGGAGDDRLFGGAGNDRADFDFTFASATITESGGTVTITSGGETDIITDVESFQFSDQTKSLADLTTSTGGNTPTTGDDTLTGTAGDDSIDGLAGNDHITGSAGDDDLYGSAGNDSLFGGDGSDDLYGGAGDDYLDAGDNTSWDDTHGSTGNDTINFSNSANGYQGLRYHDLNAAVTYTVDIAANTGSVNKGVNGTDTLTGVATPATMGGSGFYGTNFNDTFNFTQANGWTQFIGGRGNDTYNVTFNGGGTVRLDLRTDTTFNNADQGANVNLATGVISNDGFGGMDTLNVTGTGRIEVRSTDMNDTIVGSSSDETFILRAGTDTLDGGGGTDTIRYDRNNVDGVTVNLATGTATGMWDGTAFTHSLTNIEEVRGSKTGNDIMTGGSANEVLLGNGGNDTISGGAGDDRLDGGAGSDSIDGGAGNDTAVLGFTFGSASISESGGTVTITSGSDVDILTGIESFQFSDQTKSLADLTTSTSGTINGTTSSDTIAGTAGSDVMNGMDGNDVLRGLGGDDTLNGGDGADTLNGGDGDDVINGGSTSADLRDTVFAGAGNDSVDGGYGNDLIYGQDGNDLLAGGFGSDTLQGQGGDDTITGSALSDLVFGNDGNDFVNGGFGHDRINGGAGADKFYHLGIKNHGGDWVQDFSSTDGDVLVFGQAGATKDDFQVNYADSGSGDTSVDEAFIIYKPRAQLAGDNGIVWALVDGAGLTSLTIQTADGNSFDLLA